MNYFQTSFKLMEKDPERLRCGQGATARRPSPCDRLMRHEAVSDDWGCTTRGR